MYKFLSIPLFILFCSHAALAGYDIGSPSGGPFSQLGTWLQDLVDFIDGAGGVAFVVISLVIGALAWVYAPRAGGFALALRAVAAGVFVLNIAALMASFTS